MKDLRIIIIGTDHHNTLSMVRCFGEERYNVSLILYGEKDSYVAKSKYVIDSHIVQTALDALSELKSICIAERNKPVVISCSDDISSMMDLRYDELKSICHFFNAGNMGRVTKYMDKQIQLELAKNCGFCTPKSQEVFPDELNLSTVGYPCFIKPKESIHGGKNMSKCDNESELIRALSNYLPSHKVLVQEFIEKDYEIVILGLSFGDKHYMPGIVKKHRERKGGTTYSTVYPISQIPQQVVCSCEKIVNEIGYEGLWGIECIVRSNDYYFLEMNMRNDATTYAMKVAGANLPLCYYNICCQTDVAEINSIHVIDSMVEFEDIFFPFKCKISLFTWIRQLNGVQCRYFYSKEDMAPYLSKRNKFLTFILKKILHIKRT